MEFINDLLEAIHSVVGDAGVLVIVSVLIGGVGKPLVQRIKEYLGWEDKKALLLTVGVSVLLAVLHAFILGALQWGEFSAEGLVAAAGLIYTTANVLYRWFKTGEAPPLPVPGKK